MIDFSQRRPPLSLKQVIIFSDKYTFSFVDEFIKKINLDNLKNS